MVTAQKMKFSIKHFSSKCDQILRKLWIWSHLLKKSLMENFIFCAVGVQEKPLVNMSEGHVESIKDIQQKVTVTTRKPFLNNTAWND